jgi:biofilm PGA synthesis lipoprotein PgaB
LESIWTSQRIRVGRRIVLKVAAGGLLSTLAAPLRADGLPPVNPKARGSFSGVLMWHDVVERHKEVWFDTTVAELEAQFRTIKRLKLNPVTMEALADHLELGKAIAPRAVVLTFDDNNLGLYQRLWPMLKRFQFPASLFVHTGFVGKTTGKPHCTWDQLREMEKSGLVRVYPHTVTHPADLRTLKDAALDREFLGSRQAVEREMHAPRPVLSYANGFYDDRVARAAKRAGYRLAITEDHGSAESSRNLMMVHRYSMHRRSAQALQEVARGGGRR